MSLIEWDALAAGALAGIAALVVVIAWAARCARQNEERARIWQEYETDRREWDEDFREWVRNGTSEDLERLLWKWRGRMPSVCTLRRALREAPDKACLVPGKTVVVETVDLRSEPIPEGKVFKGDRNDRPTTPPPPPPQGQGGVMEAAQTLDALSRRGTPALLHWLEKHREQVSGVLHQPVSDALAGVAPQKFRIDQWVRSKASNLLYRITVLADDGDVLGTGHGGIAWFSPEHIEEAFPHKGEVWQWVKPTCECHSHVIATWPYRWDYFAGEPSRDAVRCGCLIPVNFGRGEERPS